MSRLRFRIGVITQRPSSGSRGRGYGVQVSEAANERGLVLVVEDEPAIANIIRMHLARASYGVHVDTLEPVVYAPSAAQHRWGRKGLGRRNLRRAEHG